MFGIGQLALVSIISHIIFIILAWYVITKAINLEPLLRKGKITEARVLIVFLTIIIGAGVSNFFLQILQWSRQLLFLF
ncbi:DUF1146 family protein [Lentibacillus sediminis]|uniref:DUF1146 family protein n=1 Tax=Lentibacillus sediminis TaxID=1940529 RepID=UPI000C1BB6FA|nr:DUF1146 family protein [Lentibacillus sediminis]